MAPDHGDLAPPSHGAARSHGGGPGSVPLLMHPYRRLLRNRTFALLWGGATISLLGDGLTWVSLVWLVYELGGSSLEVGIMAACYTAPVIIGGLGAGVLLDRFDRRRLLVADNLARGLAVATIPIAGWLGVLELGQLYAVAAVYGLLYMVSLAGFPAVVPEIVSDDELSTANAMESISFGIGGVAGPAIAGLLIGVVGAANMLALDALTYAAFVTCLLFVRLPSRAPVEAGPAERDGGVRPAVRLVLRSPAIMATTLMFMAFNIGEGMLLVILPVYAREVLGVGAAGYGLLVSSFTGGVLAGSVATGALRWRFPLGRSLAAAQLAAGLAVVGLVATPPLALAAMVLAGVGLLASPLTIWAQTIRMRLIPHHLRGRVFALLRTFMQGTPPLGGLAAGWLLAAGGLVPAVAAASAVMGIPGAIGAVHAALGRVPTRESVPGDVPLTEAEPP